VPVFYLNGFTNINQQIFVYDKANNKIFNTAVKNIACENSFYDSNILKPCFQEDQPIEKAYSKIESDYAPFLLNFIKKIETEEKFYISTEEKTIISKFLSFQIERTKEHREVLTHLSYSMSNKLREFGIIDEQLSNIGFGSNNIDPKEIHLDSIITGDNFRNILSDVLKKHIWFLIVNLTETLFYTSDNPVIKIPNIYDEYVSYYGFDSKGIEIIFPLTPKYLLVFCEREFFKQFEVYENKRILWPDIDLIYYYNSHQVLGSYNQIYSSDGNYKIITGLKNKYPEQFNINRRRFE